MGRPKRKKEIGGKETDLVVFRRNSFKEDPGNVGEGRLTGRGGRWLARQENTKLPGRQRKKKCHPKNRKGA